MAEKLIRDLSITTVLPAVNDYLVSDGATQETSKTLATYFPRQAPNRLALRGFNIANAADGVLVFCQGASFAGDGMGGFYRYSATSTTPPDGLTILQPLTGAGRWLAVPISGPGFVSIIRSAAYQEEEYFLQTANNLGDVANKVTAKRNLNLIANVKDFGAFGDGMEDDTVAILAAVSAVEYSGGTVYFPKGVYLTSLISVTALSNVAFTGDGIGLSVVKALTPSKVIQFSNCNRVLVKGLTFNGSCTARTAGQQAVTFDASNSLFTECEIINSGEFALHVGANYAVSNVIVSKNIIGNNYADGINFGAVTNGLIANNIVSGSDDDCIAVGYSGAGVSGNIIVQGNKVRARNDLGTNWGRGILVLRATDVLISDNIIEATKQHGILLEYDGVSAQRIKIADNEIKGCCINSGHGIGIYRAKDVRVLDNVVEDLVSGNCIDAAAWDNLLIAGGQLVQRRDQYCRGIHADESASWPASWSRIQIKNVDVQFFASNNEAVYLAPDASVSMDYVVVSNVTCNKANAGRYIHVDPARVSVKGLIVNNSSPTGNTLFPSATTGTVTVASNF